ncbi:prepilin-type N-terminal cleavage/methylation domain-containing protein [Bacillus infantis]|uniref:type IV pilus modification PilV family protein n=1 Tax=Bacillus infantis TaxID=324767 RepID=UPI001CD3F2B2|nr:prepilin-type N-terminal cleavage/methylation domain-containing protein [Bacillus infantis]MCA1036411.1 prepilin-type N-terminal cleavage/methylation domain-containing protein [Bacillus infantis]
MKLKKIINSSNGLTLVEVLLSLTILSIILLGSMKFFTQAYSYTSGSQNKTAGINVARNALMYIENESFIEIRKKFTDDPAEEMKITICDESYRGAWKDGSSLHSAEAAGVPSCIPTPIVINNVEYDVTIALPEGHIPETDASSIPLRATVEWVGSETPVKIEGAIKSEDLR